MSLTIVRDSLRATPRPRLLWLAEFVLNPLFFALFWFWLLVPESGVGSLLLSFTLAALIAIGFLTLLGATLSWYADHHAGETPTLRSAFGKGLRHFIWLGIWGFFPVAVCMVLSWAEDYQYQLPTYLRSMMPMATRAHISEAQLLWLYLFILAVLFWVVTLGVWLPVAAQLAARGFRGFGREGFRAWGRSLRSLQYWLLVSFTVLLGVWLPRWLMEPNLKQGTAFNVELSSMLGRLALAFVLALCAWMLLASAVGRAAAPVAKP